MALFARKTASFDAIKPVPDLVKLDDELNQIVGSVGVFNGNATGTRILTKYNHATEPVYEMDQLGAGLIAQFKQNGVEKARIENDGDLVANGITGAAGVYTFGSIPVGPASSPTTANQLARKQYVDDARTRWSVNWLVYDPSTFPVGTFDQVPMVKVPGAFVATHVGYLFVSGTASGSFTINISKRDSTLNPASNVVIGSMVVNSGTINTPVETDVANQTFVAGDYVFFTMSSPSSPAQRSVSFFVRGYKIPETGE